MLRESTINRVKELIDDLQVLSEADTLLQDIFSEIGPYNNRKISDETWEKVRNYFEFDDSE